MSACINLPDGRTAFMFSRPDITGNNSRPAGSAGRSTRPGTHARQLSRRNDRARRRLATGRSEAGIQRVAARQCGDRAEHARLWARVGDGVRPGSHRSHLPAGAGRFSLPAPHPHDRPCRRRRSELVRRRSRRQGPLVGTAQLARQDLSALADRLVRRRLRIHAGAGGRADEEDAQRLRLGPGPVSRRRRLRDAQSVCTAAALRVAEDSTAHRERRA